LAPEKGAQKRNALTSGARGIEKDGADNRLFRESDEGFMATQAVKSEETKSRAATPSLERPQESASGFPGRWRTRANSCTDVRVEMKQVTWPSKDDVVSTTTVVIATVFFLRRFF